MSKENPTLILWVSIALVFSLFWQLGSWGVTDSSEARYAEIAREMLENGRWTMPQYLQIVHFDKPLMTYWITALGLKIWGIDAFGARFFLQIAFLAQVFMVAKIAFELFDNRKVALYAAGMYSGTPLVLMSVRNLTTDAYLNTFALLATLCYLLYYKRNQLGWLYLFFISLGLVIFTKGPFGVLLPLLSLYPIHHIVVVQPVLNNNRLHFFIGTLIAVGIGGWWFFYLMNNSSQFYDFFIGEQLVNRLTDAGGMKRSQPFWYYVALLPLFVLPIMPLFIGSFRYLRMGSKGIKGLFIFTVLIPIVLFSASSSKLVLYILPIIPYVVILSACQLLSLGKEQSKGYWRYTLGLYGMISFALVVFSFGGVPGIPYHAGGFQLLLLVLMIGYLLYVIFIVENDKTKMLLFYLILPLFVVPYSTDIMRTLAMDINSTRPITDFIKREHLEKEPIIVWNRAVNSIPFDLQRPIYSVRYEHYSLVRRTQFQADSSWKAYLFDIKQDNEAESLKKLIQSRAVLIKQMRDSIPTPYHWLTEAFDKQVIIGSWEIYYHK